MFLQSFPRYSVICFRGRKTKLNICNHMLTSSTQRQNRSFHVEQEIKNVCKMSKKEKCTSTKNYCFSLSSIHIYYVLVAVDVVVVVAQAPYYPLAADKYDMRHAQYFRMLLLLRSLNERTLAQWRLSQHHFLKWLKRHADFVRVLYCHPTSAKHSMLFLITSSLTS